MKNEHENEIANMIQTFEAVDPILANAFKSGQLFHPQCELAEPVQDVLCEHDLYLLVPKIP